MRRIRGPALFRHAKVRLAAIQALRVTVKVPDRAKVKGAGTAAIVDLVGFREDNVLPVAAFYGRGTTTINYLAEVSETPRKIRSCSVMSSLTFCFGRVLRDTTVCFHDRFFKWIPPLSVCLP